MGFRGCWLDRRFHPSLTWAPPCTDTSRSPAERDALMSKKPNANEEYPLPTEPPELVAKREKLLAALEKQAKTATGTAQPVLRKMHELLANTKVGAPLNVNLYNEVKDAFVRFTKDPVLPPPTIIMEV